MDVGRLLRSETGPEPAFGGTLINLVVDPGRARELKAVSREFPSIDLSAREICDLEMLATGVFSPLQGFLGRADYEEVCSRGRLASGRLWPVPVTLTVPAAAAECLAVGQKVALRDSEGTMLAVLTLSEAWERDNLAEAECVFGTDDPTHPDVRDLLAGGKRICLAGTIEVLELPDRADFLPLRVTPAGVRADFERWGVNRVIAFGVNRLLHRAHVEFAQRAGRLHNASLFVLGAIGRRTLHDGGHYALVRAWRSVLPRFAPVPARLGLIELAARAAGPRAAILQGIVGRNFGCTHVVVEHDEDPRTPNHARYGSYKALAEVERHAGELNIGVVPMRELIYEEDHPEHFLAGRPQAEFVSAGERVESNVEGAQSRGIEVARWFSYPEVLHEWQKSYRLRSSQGLTIFFTGLSGAGKSTIAKLLHARLMESGQRLATLLDGDIVRKHLSAGLGFSREHRDMNVLRLGYVSSLITRHGGIAICAPIAPYAATRAQVRAAIEPYGGFIEVHVATPLEVCEARDRKGLYARARAGLIKEFTGISDPYEAPTNPELAINTSEFSADEAVERILEHLHAEGFLALESEPDVAHAEHAVYGPASGLDVLALLSGSESQDRPVARKPA
jgi:sulfate adenylyltransferase